VLQLAVSGGVVNAGNQLWAFSGRNLVAAELSGDQVNIASSTMKYSVFAQVNGLNAKGYASLSLNGVDDSGNQISFQGQGVVVGYVPSVCFPSFSVGTCASGDTSAIPAFFEVAVSTGGGGGEAAAQATQMFLFEAPILNPFGGPIVIMSTDVNGIPDGAVQIVATYDHATALWEKVTLAGSLSGTYGTTAVSGAFAQSVFASENFVKGTETESGSIAFVQMTPKDFDSAGTFWGQSVTPTNGIDCSASLGLPPGTCLETGLSSTGTFQLNSPGGMGITGKYNIVWPPPAVVFAGSMTAHVHGDDDDGQGNQNGQGGNNNGQGGGN
jgi:hypothetical protein